MMLDQIMGDGGFRSEIIWRRSTGKGLAIKGFANNHDTIFYYTSGKEYTWNRPFTPYDMENLDVKTQSKYSYSEPDGRRYTLGDLNNPNPDRPNLTYEFLGHNKTWRWTRERMQEAYEAGLVIQPSPGAVPRAKRYLDEREGRPIDDVWIDIPPLNSQAAERLGYPTQKPVALLDRIIKASSNPDDIVLDAFCGCGTALVAAERLGRRWIGIDISPTACRVMADRLKEDCKLREGRDFYVRDMPKTAEQLRKYPPFEFENWAVTALNTVLVNGHAIANRAKVGDMGIDGRIYPIGVNKKKKNGKDLFGDTDYWLPIQVKQKENAGRPDIDMFESAMRRQGREKGFFISFGFTSGARHEINRLKRLPDGLEIIPVKVEEILAEEVCYRL
jgi:DNA modification methylase